MIVNGGIVTLDSVEESIVASHKTIVTSTNGFAPMAHIPDNGTLRNVWIGGKRPLDEELNLAWNTEIQPRHNVTIENCVIFNYKEGINVADAENVKIRNCILLDCGFGFYSHFIYLNNALAKPGAGTTIENCVLLGGQGWQLHDWHHAGNNVFSRNFMGRFQCGLVSQGNSNDWVNNIIWSSNPDIVNATAGKTYPSVFLSDGKNLKYRRNFHGKQLRAAILENDADAILRNNGFLKDGLNVFGNSSQVYNDGLRDLLGFSAKDIEGMIDYALEFASKPFDAMLADENIDSVFDKLRSIAITWSKADINSNLVKERRNK